MDVNLPGAIEIADPAAKRNRVGLSVSPSREHKVLVWRGRGGGGEGEQVGSAEVTTLCWNEGWGRVQLILYSPSAVTPGCTRAR